jgi:FG-GAP repeat
MLKADGWNLLGNEIVGLNAKDQAGTGVALSGDGKRVAVGASSNDGSDENAGHVRVFDLKDNVWQQIGQDIQGEAAGDRTGKAISMSMDGKCLAIGGALNNATGTDAGHVRVYRIHELDGRWKQLGEDLDGASAGDFFGNSVALSGDGAIVAVGGHKRDGGRLYTDAGHVRVYQYNSDTRQWLQLGNEIMGPAAGSWFGFTVSLSTDGHILAVGAPGDSGFLPGYTFVYKLVNGVAWNLMGSPVWGGYSVDLSYSGKRLISSSPQGTHNGLQSGTAMVFEYNGTEWNQMGSNIVGTAPGVLAGTAVAISGDGLRVSSSAPAAKKFNVTYVGFVRTYDFCTKGQNKSP